MLRPMMIILIGTSIVIVGSIITAIGTFIHNRSSSEKSSRIDEGVTQLKQENHELRKKAEQLLNQQAELKDQLDPFIEYAIKAYPNVNLKEALGKAQEDISRLEENLAATAKLAKPVELVYDSYEASSNGTTYKVIITLSTTKHAQLGELEFTITCENLENEAHIVRVEPGTEEGNYYIFGPFYNNYSTNRKQAKLKYSPASVIAHPKVVVITNQLCNLFIEGNYDLNRTLIQIR